MASISDLFLLFYSITTLFSIFADHHHHHQVLATTVVEDLNYLKPPPDFNKTITKNCLKNPSLRYCNYTNPYFLSEIFKFTIVASHLCNESKNPNCIESFPKIDLRSRPRIAPLYLSFTFFWKYCPLTILAIDLSNNSLKGNFPSDVLSCSQIYALDLSLNDFSGDVPVQNLSLLSNLSFLNLSYNHFHESKISDTTFFRRFNSSSFFHSGLLPDRRKFKIKAIILLLAFPLFVILMVIFLGWLCFWRPDFLPRVFRRSHKFTPSMLKAATKGFSKKHFVGASSSADIYKGNLRDGNDVRIEIYHGSVSKENRNKFMKESKILVQLCHKNLVRVLGWCDGRRVRALVTEWVDEENIETWLSRSAPSWKCRLKILKGVIQGMCYLLEEWPEVSYDLKTNRILLSDSGEPLISRFRVEHQNSTPRKIYKFGALIMDILVDRRFLEEFKSDGTSLVEWVRGNYPENVVDLIDDRMNTSSHVIDQATEVIGLGLLCTNPSSERQPSLHEICNMLARIYRSCGNMASTSPDHKRRHGARRTPAHVIRMNLADQHSVTCTRITNIEMINP